jgi:hypothetical protein
VPVLGQDGVFDLAEGWGRVDAEFLGEAVAHAAVDVQRVDLAAGAVEGDHQLFAEALPQG